MEMDGEETNGRRDDGVTAVFRGTEYSFLHATVALALWPGAIFLTPSLILTALFFFPSRLSFSSVYEHPSCFLKLLFNPHSLWFFLLYLEKIFVMSYDPFFIFQNLGGAGVLDGGSSQ